MLLTDCITDLTFVCFFLNEIETFSVSYQTVKKDLINFVYYTTKYDVIGFVRP